jgi:hypothetical protein
MLHRSPDLEVLFGKGRKLREIETLEQQGVVVWTGLIWFRALVNTVMNLRVPLNVEKSLDWLSD